MALDMPEYPFLKVCPDFAQYNGTDHQVIVDRYRGWLTLHKVSESRDVLRKYFGIFGTADESAMDGGQS